MEVSHPLDAYSQIVSSVAERLTPKVASLRVPRGQGRGQIGESLGSGVVFTSDGFLLTNAHVVGHADAGRVASLTGRSCRSTWWAATRCPIWRWSAPTADAGTRRLGEASELDGGAVGGGGRQPARSGRQVTAGVVSALGRSLPTRAGQYGSSTMSSRPTPPLTRATRAARWPSPRGRGGHQHRGRRRWAGHGRPDQLHHAADHLCAYPGRPGPPRLPGPGHHAGAGARQLARTARPDDRPARGPGRPRRTGRAGPACAPGTCCSPRGASRSEPPRTCSD